MKTSIRRILPIGIGTLPVLSFAQSAGGAGGSAAFSEALQTVSQDVATYGAALVGLAAVGVVFLVAIKYVKKIRSAA